MIWIRTIVWEFIYLLTVDSADQFIDERVINKKIKQYEAWLYLARDSRIVKSSEKCYILMEKDK